MMARSTGRSSRRVFVAVCIVGLCADQATGWSLDSARSASSVGGPLRSQRRALPLSRMCHAPVSLHASALAEGEREGDAVPMWESATRAAAAGCTALAIAVGAAAMLLPAPALAENELATIAGGKLDASFVDKECFTQSCSLQAKSCLENADCLKGMTCTAKCLGDNSCITGCFAKFGNADMNELLKCSVEDHECIKIAVLPGGAEEGDGITPHRGTLVKDFAPTSLEGKWYKVMGWNSNYDCFDCQQNTFSKAGGSVVATGRGSGRASGARVGGSELAVDVAFAMPRQARVGDGAEPAPARIQRVVETMVFDDSNPSRHAHTEGHMFGLTFWENWSVIGENAKGESPFKFIYYNGRTRQNTYEGAFVYSRTAELSPDAMASVYRIAKDAGMEPAQFCQIRNSGAACPLPREDAASGVDAPGVLDGLPVGGASAAASKAPVYMGIYAAEAATVTEDQALAAMTRSSGPADAAAPAAAGGAPAGGVFGAIASLKHTAGEISEYLEDPHVSADWMFSQQQKVDWGPIGERR